MSAPLAGYACEDAARAALVGQLRRLRVAGIGRLSAVAALRWSRSGADGMLLAAPLLPDDDAMVGELGGNCAGEGDADRATDRAVALDGVSWIALTTASRDPGNGPAMLAARLFRQRPQVAAILQLDAPHATALSCLERVQRDGIPAILADVLRIGGRSIGCATGSMAAIAATLAHRDACLLANCGLLAAGSDLLAAAALATRLEAIAATWWRILQVAEPVVLLDSPAE